MVKELLKSALAMRVLNWSINHQSPATFHRQWKHVFGTMERKNFEQGIF
jgi:hypothetical protein